MLRYQRRARFRCVLLTLFAFLCNMPSPPPLRIHDLYASPYLHAAMLPMVCIRWTHQSFLSCFCDCIRWCGSNPHPSPKSERWLPRLAIPPANSSRPLVPHACPSIECPGHPSPWAQAWGPWAPWAHWIHMTWNSIDVLGTDLVSSLF